MIERWINVYDNDNYEVSNLGNVRNKKTGKLLTPVLNRPNGYGRVTMGDKREYVHRIVAKSFFDVSECDIDNLDINHINGDKNDNRLPNLEICTRKENIRHAYESGLKPIKVVTCRYCKHRRKYDHCRNKPDSFFCSYGEI